MERKVGEVFGFKVKQLLVEACNKDNGFVCKECFFNILPCEVECIHKVIGECRKGKREDGNNVIFRECNLPKVSQLPPPPEKSDAENVRSHNVGNSDYSQHSIQPWDIWIEYRLNPFDADIQKRLIRKKKEPGMTRLESRKLDYKKIIHICQERLRQLDEGIDPFEKEEE